MVLGAMLAGAMLLGAMLPDDMPFGLIASGAIAVGAGAMAFGDGCIAFGEGWTAFGELIALGADMPLDCALACVMPMPAMVNIADAASMDFNIIASGPQPRLVTVVVSITFRPTLRLPARENMLARKQLPRQRP